MELCYFFRRLLGRNLLTPLSCPVSQLLRAYFPDRRVPVWDHKDSVNKFGTYWEAHMSAWASCVGFL
jgi:hypothetical protein